MFLRVVVFVSGLVFQATPGIAQTNPDNDRHITDELRLVVESATSNNRVPGASIALIDTAHNWQSFATAGQVQRSGASVTEDSSFLGGSIGKTFAAIVTVQLAQEGLLDLDDPISTFLSDRPWFDALQNADDITLRQLLNHSAGIPDYLENWQYFLTEMSRARHGFTPDELVAFVARDTLIGEPGAHYSYSDTHFIIVGMILETVTGTPYVELVRQRVIEPLSLQSTQMLVGRRFEHLTTGYEKGPFGGPAATGRDGTLNRNIDYEWAAGGIVTTPQDLARLFSALGNDELPGVRDLMMNDANPINVEHQVFYGLGVFVRYYDGGHYRLFHGGGFAGYRSAALFDSRTGYAIAIQANSKFFDAPDVILELTERLVEVASVSRSD